MDLNLFGLLIDSGLCVLAWMVQLIVYPGFLYLLLWLRKRSDWADQQTELE